MKKLLALLLALAVSSVSADETANLITSTWSGVQVGTIPSNYMPGGPTPKYDPNTNTFQFSYGQATVSQTIAINNALSGVGAGVQINGYRYSYELRNMNGDDRQNGVDSITINTAMKNAAGTTLLSGTEVFNTKFDWTPVSGVRTAQTPYQLNEVNTLSFSATSKDSGFWAGYFGPQVRNVDMRLNYTVDACAANPLSNPSCPGYTAAYLTMQCSANPLYSPSCPGYAAAVFTQQCSANPLSDPSCPGYANAYLTYQCSINPLYSTTCSGYETAYFNQQCSENPLYSTRCSGYASAYQSQQCSINPLYSTTCTGYAGAYQSQQCSINPLYSRDCPGYQAAYLTQQCSANPLYSTTCSGYAAAYAKKMLLEQQGLATTVATAGTVAKTAEVANAATTTTTTSDGSSSVAVAVVADPIVNAAVTSTATSTSPAAAATATVSLAPAPAPAAAVEAKVEAKPAAPAPMQAPAQGDKPAQPTARQALAERRAEAAKKDAVAKGNNLAKEMGKVADMEAQKQVQNVVIAAMGFTPGFDAYGKSFVPDGVGYKPFTVYAKQVNVDNVRLGRRLYGPSDRLHDELVESQYKGN